MMVWMLQLYSGSYFSNNFSNFLVAYVYIMQKPRRAFSLCKISNSTLMYKSMRLKHLKILKMINIHASCTMTHHVSTSTKNTIGKTYHILHEISEYLNENQLMSLASLITVNIIINTFQTTVAVRVGRVCPVADARTILHSSLSNQTAVVRSGWLGAVHVNFANQKTVSVNAIKAMW